MEMSIIKKSIEDMPYKCYLCQRLKLIQILYNSLIYIYAYNVHTIKGIFMYLLEYRYRRNSISKFITQFNLVEITALKTLRIQCYNFSHIRGRKLDL